MPKIALSHSRLSDFNQCPLKFKYKYLDKAPNFQIDQQDKNVHLVRGENVHKALEKYVICQKAGSSYKSSLNEVNDTLPLIDKHIKLFGVENVYPEAQISVDENWQKVDWFSKATAYRAIFDFTAVSEKQVTILDWKTGKVKDYSESYGQLELSAAIALSNFGVETVKTAYVFVDHKKIIPRTYTKDNLDDFIAHFNSELEKVNAETEFKPKANQYCNFCQATKDQCKYSRAL